MIVNILGEYSHIHLKLLDCSSRHWKLNDAEAGRHAHSKGIWGNRRPTGSMVATKATVGAIFVVKSQESRSWKTTYAVWICRFDASILTVEMVVQSPAPRLRAGGLWTRSDLICRFGRLRFCGHDSRGAQTRMQIPDSLSGNFQLAVPKYLTELDVDVSNCGRSGGFGV